MFSIFKKHKDKIIRNPFLASSLIVTVGVNAYNLGQFLLHIMVGRMLGKDFGGHIISKCKICGKKFKYFKSSPLNRECCSNKCRHILHREKIKGIKHPLWTGGAKGWRGCDWKYTRLLVLKRDEQKCQHCGKTKRLHIHHRTPYRLSKDNSFKNLITLCISCHFKEDRRIAKSTRLG